MGYTDVTIERADALRTVVADLAEETGVLDHLLSSLQDDDWLCPTPAERWDIRDTIAHLAMSDEMALECVERNRVPVMMQRGIDALVVDDAQALLDLEADMLARGRALAPRSVHDWWRCGTAALRAAFDVLDPQRRLPWGPNAMSAPSFVSARLMETWAHGLDCFAAVGAEVTDTDRLRHVALIALRSLPYAFLGQGVPGPGPVRLELVSPTGVPWDLGPPDAPTVISGSASDWCRVAVQRDRGRERERLKATGPDADAVIRHVKAYL